MNFKLWLLSEEQIFNEDFKSQREKFIQQGYDANIVDRYITDFKTIKDKKYKQINDPIHGLEYIKNRIDIDQYKDFQHLEALVDYVKGQVDVSGKTSYKNIKVDAKPVYEDNNIIVYYADSPQACITYKGSVPYSWCVARSDSSNMYYTYRMKDYEPAFYFVKNKEKTNKEFSAWNTLKLGAKAVTSGALNFIDKYHFFVIQVVKNANPKDTNRQQYIVTSASNDGDKQMSWNDILKIEPFLAGKETIFESKPLQPNERELFNKYSHGLSDEEFAKLPYDQKDMYLNVFVRLDQRISDDQFKNLPFDLKNKYIGYAVGLTDEQFNLIVNDSKLAKRYEDVTLTKLQKMFDENLDIELLPSEIEILTKNISKFDLNKLSGYNVRYLLHYATNKEEMAKTLGSNNINKLSDESVSYLLNRATDEDKYKIIQIIIEKKTELSDQNVFYLLQYAIDKDKMAKLIINKKTKLSDNNVRDLLQYAPDKDKMAQIIINKKKELSAYDVYYLLHYATNKEEMAKTLGSNNINKLSDDNVYNLLRYAKDKDQMAQILGADNINKLSDDNVRDLLQSAPDKDQMAQILGSDNINKLSDYNVRYLLQYAPDKDKIAQIIGTYNINKLDDDQVSNLLRNEPDKGQMAQLISQYHNKKTPKIQKLIDKYL